jgi:hypothetical protein
MRVFTAPQLPLIGASDTSVFLAGSIEMGSAIDWQKKLIDDCSFLPDNWVFLNPRREHWDPSWQQSIENPHFYQQVDWELTHLDRADHIVFYLDPATKSPISLLEIGKFANTYSTYIVCPKSFYRRGNIEIFCHKYRTPLYEKLEDVVNEFRKLNATIS